MNFVPFSPKPTFAFSIAAHSRFAKAEEVASRLMQGEALQLLRDHNTLAAHVTNSILSGSFGERALVRYLFDSRDKRGMYLQFPQQLRSALETRGEAPIGPRPGFIIFAQALNTLAISSLRLDRRSSGSLNRIFLII